jgi:hypothetical protein
LAGGLGQNPIIPIHIPRGDSLSMPTVKSKQDEVYISYSMRLLLSYA